MVNKSVWTGWSDAAPVRPSHAENESDLFFTERKCGSSHSPLTANEPIRAAAHARHSISAGLELIKLSISDTPVRMLLFIECVLLPLLFSLPFLFCFLSFQPALVPGVGTQMLILWYTASKEVKTVKIKHIPEEILCRFNTMFFLGHTHTHTHIHTHTPTLTHTYTD